MALVVVDIDTLMASGESLSALATTYQQEVAAVKTLPDVVSPEIAESSLFADAATNAMAGMYGSADALATMVHMAGVFATQAAALYRALDVQVSEIFDAGITATPSSAAGSASGSIPNATQASSASGDGSAPSSGPSAGSGGGTEQAAGLSITDIQAGAGGAV